MSTTATYQCDRCKADFVARTADRARGWARFCSKSCKASKQLGAQIRKAKKARPYQRYDLCQSRDDVADLMRNPRIIAPLYNEWDERDGEEFFAGGEPWDHG